ncbi:hypothetical protein KM043_013867 [Ampulex compressa]|nr:hypothetical protein KM043_013867 [Ampulex compressa]
MKRNYQVDVRTNDCPELTRRLHKSITEIGKKLDDQRCHALSIADLFSTSNEALRSKFKDYCVRLIFKDPMSHARKIEEPLWRKGFYDIVYTAKKLRKGDMWNDVESALLSVHLAVGVGFYHHLILKLQSEYNLNLIGAIDFAVAQDSVTSLHTRNKGKHIKSYTEESRRCILRLVHRSLVCLGDLARYKLELESTSDPAIAKRYYKMAIAIDPSIGMPLNQLGTIAGDGNYGLDAVYHYTKCVLCAEPFEGAEGNLRKAIVTHSVCTDDKSSPRRCITKLFCLLQLWDYDIPNSERINLECQDLLNNLETSLNLDSKETDTKINDIYNQPNLTDNAIFKIFSICLMSISRLKIRECNEAQGVIAITLAILSQLIQFTYAKLHQKILEKMSKESNHVQKEISQKSTSNCVEEEMCIHPNYIEKETADKSASNCVKKTIAERYNYIEKKLLEQSNCIKENTSEKLISTTSEKENFHKDFSLKHVSKDQSKNRKEKTVKNLLKKLRRRKRRNSSDSEASDGQSIIFSSNSESDDEDKNFLTEDELTEDEENVIQNSEKNVFDPPEILECFKDNEKIENLENLDKSLEKLKDSNSSCSIKNTMEPDTFFISMRNLELTYDEVINILSEGKLLTSIKISCDWLKSNPEIVKNCARSSKTLLKRLMSLINLINLEATSFIKTLGEENSVLFDENKLKEFVKTIPLPEDIELRGLNLLEEAQRHLDWHALGKLKLNRHDEMILRVFKIVEFGIFLCDVEGSCVHYDQDKKLFVSNINSSEKVKSDIETESEHPRGRLMRHMGKLWLKAEVRALESRLRSRLMSPYLVPDHEALARHMPALKRLVYAKKFVVVIPAVVVSALDEVKRISSSAREATRWLEGQLRRGSRFLRAQRPHEHLAVPLIKGPRPKDKEAWLFFQIIECCHYLTQQTKVGLTNDAEVPVVTLLTGCDLADKKTTMFRLEGLAKSAGVNVEHVESFYTKWKASSKSHG